MTSQETTRWSLDDSVAAIIMDMLVQSPSKEIAAELLQSSMYDRRRTPSFLANVAPDSEVNSRLLDILDSFQRNEDGTELLAEAVKGITGATEHLFAQQYYKFWYM